MDVTPLALAPWRFETIAGAAPGGSSQHVTLLFLRIGGLAGVPRAAAVDAVRFSPAAEARLLPTPPGDAAALRHLLEEAEGGDFVDTESDEGRDLVRALASRSPFIENSESISSIRVLAFRKPRENGAGVVSGLLVATPDGARAYRNVCPHVSIPLDRDGEPLLTADGLFLVCRNHGALFEPEDGLCVAGPCEGESLDPLRIVRRAGGLGARRRRPAMNVPILVALYALCAVASAFFSSAETAITSLTDAAIFRMKSDGREERRAARADAGRPPAHARDPPRRQHARERRRGLARRRPRDLGLRGEMGRPHRDGPDDPPAPRRLGGHAEDARRAEARPGRAPLRRPDGVLRAACSRP